MTDTKWTPGPWRVEFGTTLVWGATSDETAYMKWPVAKAELAQPWQKRGRPTYDEAIANACLIAAAPALYAWLERCLAMVEHGEGPPNWDGIRAVLAKARGDKMDKEQDFDFMGERLKIPICCYNSEVDAQIYSVAKMIVDARKRDTVAYNSDISKALGMSPEHVELIQYILAPVVYPGDDQLYLREPFSYGTSPRGLFVGSMEHAEKFLQEFREYYERQWGEPVPE